MPLERHVKRMFALETAELPRVVSRCPADKKKTPEVPAMQLAGRSVRPSLWIATGRGAEGRSHREAVRFLFLFFAMQNCGCGGIVCKKKKKKTFRLGFIDGTNEFCLKLITSLILIDLETAFAKQIRGELQYLYTHLGQKEKGNKFPF